MFDFTVIDRAALAGFDAVASGARMPAYVWKDQLLMDAWNLGKRQATDCHPELSDRRHSLPAFPW